MNTLSPLILFLLFSQSICAQFEEREVIHQYEDFQPQVSSIADIDGDGDLDIIKAGGWLEQQEMYNYGPYHRFDESYFFSETYPGDIDGDGDLDILAEQNFSGFPFLFQLINDGQGNFEIQSLFSGQVLSLGDLDGNSFPDLLYIENSPPGSNEPEIVRIAFNENGLFQATTETDMTSDGRPMQLIDSDADGDLDIFHTVNHDPEVWQNENGQFAHISTIPATTTFYSTQATLTHFNNDELLDVVQLGGDDGLLTVNMGLGSNLFDEGQVVEGNIGIYDVNGLRSRLGDFNGDGYCDLGHFEDNQFKLALNDQNLGLEEALIFEAPFSLQVLACDDYTGDGSDEVVYSNYATEELNMVDFDEVASTHTLESRLLGTSLYFETADYDGDGDEDLLVNSSLHGFVAFDNVQGYFEEPKRLAQITQHRDLRIFDGDGDGQVEFYAVPNELDGHLSQLTLNSENELELNAQFNTNAGYFGELDYADMDKDGHPDILGFMDSRWRIIYNDGTGDFSAPPTLLDGNVNDPGIYGHLMQLLDYDNDGDLDFLYTIHHQDTRKLEWLENLGSRSFAPPQLISPVSDFGFHVADIDGDGDYDLLNEIVYEQGIEILVNENNLLQSHQILEDLDQAFAWQKTAYFDVDADGDIDFIDSNTVFLNDGEGIFTVEQELNLMDIDPTILVADITQDGAPDLIANYGLQQLVSYRNTGSPPLSLKESSLRDFRFYPEPVTAFAKLEFQLKHAINLHLAVISNEGKVLWEEAIDKLGQGHQVITLDQQLKSLPTGIYHLRISSERELLRSHQFLKLASQ